MRVSTLLLSVIAQLAVAEPIPVELAARAAPSVDLGYAIYTGSYDATSKVNSFKGFVSSHNSRIEFLY